MEAPLKRLRVVTALLSLLLLVAVATSVLLYRSRPVLAQPGDGPLIARTVKDPHLRWLAPETLTPIVIHLHDRTCIDLRPRSGDGAGSATICYDLKTGRPLEEIERTGF